jgi:serine/threonine protein phosphatase PrpC
LSKSNQIPLTTLSTNFKNQTSNLNQPLKSNLNNKIISQENENISNSFHTLSSNSKVFRINNISFEPSVEIVQLENQYNTMIEKTTQSLEEELQSVDLNEDFESNFIENEDISLVDNKKDVDVITESDNDSDDAKTKINEDISNELDHTDEDSELSSFDELDILGDDNFDKKDNINDNLFVVKMKLQEAEKTDSDATVISSPSISHSDDSLIGDIDNNGNNQFKILYSCSNEPKNYRTTGLPAICKKDCGEDAYFELDQNNFMVFGIADGVGGWNKSGVDPSLFAWDLMNSCKEASQYLNDWPDPKTVLIDGYDTVVRKKEVKAGSSTACILTLDKISGIVYSTNLGDSGFIVIRDNKVIFKTQEQQHYFNAPYQLSIIPDTTIAYLQNTPHDAYDDQFTAEEGDVIVLGTDGLWDNMYNEDIIKILKDDINNIKECKAEVKNREEYLEWEKNTNEVLSGLSFQLTQQAKKYSQDWYRESPFSKKFVSTGQYYSGGKIDDITIILMYVTYDRYSSSK